ncbi:MAG: beta-ketoacyl-ACP synthase II [Chloroflexi bacterium]|nr:beta-ketoacyl-ACP synthase II [Chloroflexota bacterium]
MSRPRLVITGVSALTPVGLDAKTTWENLVNGVSGVDYITLFDPTDYPVRIAAEVKGFDPARFMPRKEARRTTRAIHFAVALGRMALEDAGLEITEENAERVAVLMYTGGGGISDIYDATLDLLNKGPRGVSPFVIPNVMPNAVSCQISIREGIKGPVLTGAAACASGNMAFVDALRLLWLGEADAAIVGGVESGINPVAIASLARAGALSRRNDEPQKASRPFDKNRDGFVFGEGGAAVIVETEEHARKRGARIYAELVGGAVTGDAFHITAPPPGGEGAARAMRLAMERSRIAPEDVDVISAHATSTPLNDVAETQAIKAAFGDHAYKLAITATKSMVGHLLGGAGAISSFAAIMSIYSGIVPPTINLEEPDPECDLDYVPNEAREMPVRVALSNGFGFGGQNAVVVFRKYT